MKKILVALLIACMVLSVSAVALAGVGVPITDETDLQEAFNDGGSYKLDANIELNTGLHLKVGKTLELDLNGYSISQTKAQTAGYQMILNDGTLIIDDNAGNGKISYTDSGNGGAYISDTIYNRSVLIINGGTIENNSSSTVASNGYPHAVDTYSGDRDTSVTINGGTIVNNNYSAIRMFCVSATNKADLVINDGTIKGAVDMQNGTVASAIGTLTINGGTFDTTANANNIRFANWNGGATTYGITASIKGGNFDGGITTQYVPSGSEFDSKIISGGTFAEQPKSEYIADGYTDQFVSTENGYEVVAVVTIGDKGYPSLEEALEAAVAGDTITLNADIKTSSKITITKGITLDGNGHTLTYTKDDRAIDMPDSAGKAEITIKNLNVECSASYCQRGINYNASGKLTLENVTVKTTGYAINLPGKADNCVVTIKGGSYTGCIALNVWGANSKITAENTVFTTVDNNSEEGYCTVKLNNDGTTSAENTVITINGGKVDVTGTSPNGSHALSNATTNGKIQISGAEVNGDSIFPVAIVDYGTDNFYSMTTLQNAINRAIQDGNGAKAKLLKDVDEVVEVNASVELDVNDHTNTKHIYLTAENVELTAAKGLNVYSKVDGYKVIYEDGVYKLVEGEEIIPVTVTFAANDGTDTKDSVEVNPGSYTLPANGFFAPEGKQFSAWEVKGEEYAPGASITVTEDITVTAVWENIPTVTISFDANGGSGTMDPVTVAKGKEYTLPENRFTAPGGKQFKAWSVSNTEADPDDSVAVTADANDTTVTEYAPGTSITVDKDITVTAVWEDIPRTAKITFNLNGGTSDIIDDIDAYPIGKRFTLPTEDMITPHQYLLLMGWGINGDVYQPGEEIEIKGDVEIMALWKLDPNAPTYEVTFDPNGGTPNGGTSMDLIWIIIKGSNIQLPEEDYITAPAGMKFSAYLINGEKHKALDIVPVPGDMTVKVLWEDIAAAPVVTPAPTAAPAAPKTGDNTNLALWMALMAISAVALVGLRKKSKASK